MEENEIVFLISDVFGKCIAVSLGYSLLNEKILLVASRFLGACLPEEIYTQPLLPSSLTIFICQQQQFPTGPWTGWQLTTNVCLLHMKMKVLLLKSLKLMIYSVLSLIISNDGSIYFETYQSMEYRLEFPYTENLQNIEGNLNHCCLLAEI